MRKLILVVILILVFAPQAYAWDFGWSGEYNLIDCINLGEGADSAGICFGTLGEVRLVNGLKPVGLGGFSASLNADGNVALGIIPLTLLNDILWLGFTIDTNDFAIDNWREDIKPTFGISLTSAIRKLWQ